MDAHQNPIVATVNFRTLSTLLLSPLALYPVVSAVALGSSVYVTFINGPVSSLPSRFPSIPRLGHYRPVTRSGCRTAFSYLPVDALQRDRLNWPPIRLATNPTMW